MQCSDFNIKFFLILFTVSTFCYVYDDGELFFNRAIIHQQDNIPIQILSKDTGTRHQTLLIVWNFYWYSVLYLWSGIQPTTPKTIVVEYSNLCICSLSTHENEHFHHSGAKIDFQRHDNMHSKINHPKRVGDNKIF